MKKYWYGFINTIFLITLPAWSPFVLWSAFLRDSTVRDEFLKENWFSEVWDGIFK